MRHIWVLFALPLTLAVPFIPILANDIPQTGSSPGYSEASNHLKQALNLTADPCDDFFEFACGRWIAGNPIPKDLTSYGNFQKLREKIQMEMRDLYESDKKPTSKAIDMLRSIYKGCMDEQKLNDVGSAELLDSLKTMNYWPMLHTTLWQESHFDLTDLLIHIASSRGTDVFIDIYVGTDIKNVTRRLIQFDQSSLGLGSSTREYYLNPDKYSKQMNAYRALLINKTKLLTSDAGMDVHDNRIEKDVEELLDFETKFANITVPEDERRNFSALYNLRHLSDLNDLFPLMDWNRYFRAVMPFETHEYLDTNPEIVITEIDYFRRLAELLQSTDPRIITNYVLMRFTSSWSMQLGSKYEDIAQDFARDMYGRKEKAPRWKDCVSSTNGKMMFASGSMYVRGHFDKESKNTTLSMIGDLQEAFHNMLVENDWMDKDTKEFAKKKADEIIKQIGYPDFILDDEKLDDWYKELQIEATDSYSQMINKQIRYATNFQYKRLLEPVDRTEFGANPATVNAFYSSIKNAIMFPAAILQVPFFHHSYPKALNYGGIGAVIGHEITHGFDDQGRQFDDIGNLRDWWDATTTEKFEERTKCVVEQYGSIEVPDIGLKINGKLTQGENIADNGGIKEAFKAYKRYLERNGPEKRIAGLEQYDNEQMFFIGYSQTWCGHMTPESSIRQILTDPHAPGRYRVNVVLQNQPEFAAAFKCPSGSAMNPTHRCSVW
ncbi:unnamed protein product [Auanema sp. JU1783]|nr:unnamed protein product [Auanema sp. JU1783]